MDHTGSAAAHYAALRHESTIQRWLLAVTIGAATGLFTNLVLPWPLPLLAAVITVAVLMIWDRRHGTIADWWPGDHPPHRLAATAARLERHGWTALPEPAHTGRDTALAAYDQCGFTLDRDLNAARNLTEVTDGMSSPSCGATINEPDGNPGQTHTVWAAGTATGRPAPPGAGQRRRRKATAA